MPMYEYTVKIQAASREQAEQVMSERISFDEDYGFSYTLGFEPAYPPPVEAIERLVGEWRTEESMSDDLMRVSAWMDSQ